MKTLRYYCGMALLVFLIGYFALWYLYGSQPPIRMFLAITLVPVIAILAIGISEVIRGDE